MNRVLNTLAGALLGLAAATPVAAGDLPLSPEFPETRRDAGASMQELAPGVFAIIHSPATDYWPHGNTGVVVGTDAVLVIDSTFEPARALADIKLIRSVTALPVRYLVNSHWHGDHTHGNETYRREFPGLTIIGTAENRQFIGLNQEKLPRSGSEAAELAELEQRLANGHDEKGVPLSAEARERLQTSIAGRRVAVAELAKVRPAPPNFLFEHEATLELGGDKRVVIQEQGRANSPSDVTVYLPNQQVLFTGDILVYPRPLVGGSYPVSWIAALKRLEELPVHAVVPGHGKVLADHAYTRTVRSVFEAARARVDATLRSGRSPLDDAHPVDLSDLRKSFEPTAFPSDEFFASWCHALVDRMTACVQGYGC